MPNNYFRFRQFTVQQDRCAMKVCTDACLFGAWAAATLGDLGAAPVRVLDAGAGTGLLALMLAQAFPHAKIDAVEIDRPAAEQAANNFAASPWAGQMNVMNVPLQDYSPDKGLYDVVISNPPFYENDLRSDDPARNLAFHNATLDLAGLFAASRKLLQPAGFFCVLIPARRADFFEALLVQEKLHISRKISVRQTPSHALFRCMYVLQATSTQPAFGEMTIREADRFYSDAFRRLLKDYYLFSEPE